MKTLGSILIVMMLAFGAAAQNNSVLATGQWLKIPISHNGMYKIDKNYLSNLDIDLNNIDPKDIAIFGNPGGVLPQSNNKERQIGLKENAIWVVGENDGKFDDNDFIVFYAEGPHDYSYHGGELVYDHNIYSNENYYFLTVADKAGKRITDIETIDGSYPVIDTFDDFAHHEEELTNLLISGREWYGEKFSVQLERNFEFQFPFIKPSSNVEVKANVMAQSFTPVSFDLKSNGDQVGSISVESVPDFNENANRYEIKGKESLGEFSFIYDGVSDESSLVTLNLKYNKASSGQSVGYLNYLTIEAQRRLRFSSPFTVFRSIASIENPISTYNISGTNTSLKIWNIANPNEPSNQLYVSSASGITYSAVSESLQEYVVFEPSQLSIPADPKKINNQNVRGLSSPDLLIITHPSFLSAANRLAAFKQSNDNLEVQVVTTEQVYNEFSSGRQDISALRDFTKHLYDKNSRLKYLLLMGKGSYDYKDVVPDNKNFVPIYQSRNSLDPLDTYASDDFFGFMETDEGEWEEKRGGNHTLELGVGRFPVSTLEEANSMVDKIITYNTDPKTVGSWRNEVLFVADDGDLNLHQSQSDQLSVILERDFPDFNANKFFLDDFNQISNPDGQRSPNANNGLTERIERGALLINYTGHGGEIGWMQEQVLDLISIERWDNDYKMPLFVTATCEFGRHDDPGRVSGGELVVTRNNGGGIAIVSTCRPVSSSSNFALNKAFFDVVFEKNNGQHLRLGDILRITKNESVDLALDNNRVGNRNFALLGDPSLRLTYPKKDITITSINGNKEISDTLKALSKVNVKGQVQNDDGSKDATFNGVLDITVFDKPIQKATLGNENPQFRYSSTENAIFRGTADVVDGDFEVEFIVPKNISYQIGTGKISMYASDINNKNDANGANVNFSIGGSAPNAPEDKIGPEIELFISDSTQSRSVNVSHNTTLYARLSDNSGINISGFGVGNSLLVILDEKETFIVNDFYQTDRNSFKSGWVTFPLSNLDKGRHSLRFVARDTYNNSSEKTLEFHVADPNKLFISDFSAIPNPFRNQTQIGFSHNRAGEDLDVTLEIHSSHGAFVISKNISVDNSPERVDLIQWNAESTQTQKKINPGLYLMRVEVRSKLDGSKSQSYKKLILIN